MFRNQALPFAENPEVASVREKVVAIDLNRADQGELPILRSAASAVETEDRKLPLIRAVEVYRNHLLPNRSDLWILGERERLVSKHAKAVLQLTALFTEAGDLEEALQVAQRGAAFHPLDEEIHREIIRLNLLLDRPTAARRQYQTLQRLLKVELDAEPSPTTRALFDRIEPAFTREEKVRAQEGSPRLDRDATDPANMDRAHAQDVNPPTPSFQNLPPSPHGSSGG